MPATELLMVTATTAELDRTWRAWTEASGYRGGPPQRVTADLLELWSVAAGSHHAAVLTGVPGLRRGLVRFVDTSAPAQDGPMVRAVGPFGFEFFSRDVDEAHRRMAAGGVFEPLTPPTDYDLQVIGSGRCRSFGARGPGGVWMLLTTMQWVPPPRKLPRTGHLVGPVVNMPIAAVDRPAALAFYQGLLGIGVRFDGEVQSAEVNRIMAAPPDWRFRITVFFLADGQLAEHHFHPAGRLAAALPRAGALPSGPAIVTFTVEDLDDVLGRASQEGHKLRGPVCPEVPPYHGRRVVALDGPSGELVELVEA